MSVHRGLFLWFRDIQGKYKLTFQLLHMDFHLISQLICKVRIIAN